MVPAGAATADTARPARNTDTSYSFALVTPNTAVAPIAGMMASPGDSIRVTGAGWFDPKTKTVHAGGAFIHDNADGTVHCRGTWKATALTGWTDFGARGGYRHGGVISLLVTHYCPAMGEVHTGIPMTVTSALNAPPGSTYTTGVTVGDFTVPTGGKVRITGHQGPRDPHS
jgi:hypothetical protein